MFAWLLLIYRFQFRSTCKPRSATSVVAELIFLLWAWNLTDKLDLQTYPDSVGVIYLESNCTDTQRGAHWPIAVPGPLKWSINIGNSTRYSKSGISSSALSWIDSLYKCCWRWCWQVGMLSYDEDGQLDMSGIVPMVDGGTEGFKGNARVIIPGISACVECTLDLYPPQVICSVVII